MHYRLFVTFNKDKAGCSVVARKFVNDYLDEEGFCGQGRFGGGMADWFIVGGKYSGTLTKTKRDSYKEFGEEDDACMVDEVIYKNLLKKYEKNDNIEEFIDVEDTELTPENFIGKKWIVVVDYHN